MIFPPSAVCRILKHRSVAENHAISNNYQEEWDVNEPPPGHAYDRAMKEFAQRLPRAEVVPKASRAMRILFLTNAHNGMSQALYLKLTALGHQVREGHYLLVW